VRLHADLDQPLLRLPAEQQYSTAHAHARCLGSQPLFIPGVRFVVPPCAASLYASGGRDSFSPVVTSGSHGVLLRRSVAGLQAKATSGESEAMGRDLGGGGGAAWALIFACNGTSAASPVTRPSQRTGFCGRETIAGRRSFKLAQSRPPPQKREKIMWPAAAVAPVGLTNPTEPLPGETTMTKAIRQPPRETCAGKEGLGLPRRGWSLAAGSDLAQCWVRELSHGCTGP
jgi:hypothetical protein